MRVLGILLALLIAMPATADAQVWKPRSHQGAKAKTSSSKTRKTSKATVKRTKATPAKPTPPAVKKRKRRGRGDDDFTIIEEDYPDE